MAAKRLLCPPVPLASFALLVGGLCGCREGTSNQSAFNPIVSPSESTQGCNAVGITPVAPTLVHTAASIGAGSQIVASTFEAEDTFFYTGVDGAIHRLEVPGAPDPVVDTVVVSAAAISADYLSPLGMGLTPQLSGITILNPNALLVVESVSNTVMLVRLNGTPVLSPFAGQLNLDGGFADGFVDVARFDFTGPTQVLVNSVGEAYVADPGNHAVRIVTGSPLARVGTLAGTGTAGFRDGGLTTAMFDTPVGLAVSCGGELLVTELGLSLAGGRRVRSLAFGDPDFFGNLTGSVTTLAGDGTEDTTDGVDGAAAVAGPMGPVATSGEILWIDSATGILRRHDLATGQNTCPLFTDCSTAVMMGGNFPVGLGYSMAVGLSGLLYVLDGNSGTISIISL